MPSELEMLCAELTTTGAELQQAEVEMDFYLTELEAACIEINRCAQVFDNLAGGVYANR